MVGFFVGSIAEACLDMSPYDAVISRPQVPICRSSLLPNNPQPK